MTVDAGNALGTASRRVRIVATLGFMQILAWGSSFYLPAVLAAPIANDTGWPAAAVVGGLSWSLLVGGLASPRIGRIIDARGGRPVLTASSLLFAAGLAGLGAAPNLVFYFAAWTVFGLAMAAGLYDAAFATLGRLFGASARASITGLTLFGGLASTIGWPTIAALEDVFGWRGACFALAAIHLAIGVPVNALLVPRAPAGKPRARHAADDAPRAGVDLRFMLVTAAFTVYAFMLSGISVHILEILRQLGLGAAAAVAVGMVIGPSQVTSRLVEFAFGRRAHPLWTARCGMAFCVGGLALLLGAGVDAALAAMIVYGIGNGIITIARGTVPLAIFGPHNYGARIGLMARPMLVAQALAPIVMAEVMERAGPQVCLTMAVLLALPALMIFVMLRVRPIH